MLALSRAERYSWVELLCWTVDVGSSNVPAGVRDAVPSATPALLSRALKVGLLEEDFERGGYRVHHWELYNGHSSVAERVALVLESQPDITANELVQQVGGRRAEVLEELRSQRSSRSDGSGVVPGDRSLEVPGNRGPGSPSPRARAFPSLPSKEGTGSLDVAPAALNEQAPAPVDEGPAAELPACDYCGGRPAELEPHLLERHRAELERDSAGMPWSSLEAFAGATAKAAAKRARA
jgi:hypothetical protein